MKILFRIVVVILAALLIASAAGTLYYYNRINNEYDSHAAQIFDDDPQYHFSLILSSSEDDYWQEFKEGVFEAAKVYDAAIELNLVDELDTNNKTVEYIDIATKSKVDGIIVNGHSTIEYGEVIGDAAQVNINIVLAGEEVEYSNRLSYVGTNFYEYGVQAAKLISQIGEEADGTINLAVILGSQNSKESNSMGSMQNNNMINGLKTVVEEGRQIELICTPYRSSDLLGAEDLTRSILTEYPDIDVIFCTNAKDTLIAARVIVERNLVGQVTVVGTDVTPEIMRYIDKGIIHGVVDRNGYAAGYKSVEMLCNNRGEAFQSIYEAIDLRVYTKVNMGTYQQ